MKVLIMQHKGSCKGYIMIPYIIELLLINTEA